MSTPHQSLAPSSTIHGNARTSTVLAVGASGKFAGLVIPELAKLGVIVRGLVRESKDGREVRQHGASEIAVADLRDRASMEAVLGRQPRTMQSYFEELASASRRTIQAPVQGAKVGSTR